MSITREEYLNKMKGNDAIEGDLYKKFSVKRGLRNDDGTGVLVGLTRVGDVHGYDVRDGVKVAVPGKLFYRGIDLEEIVAAAAREKRFAFEETIYLLMFGQLPTNEELSDFSALIANSRSLPIHFTEDSIMKFPAKDIKIGRASCRERV